MVNLLKNNTWRDVGTISQVLAHLTAKLKVSPEIVTMVVKDAGREDILDVLLRASLRTHEF